MADKSGLRNWGRFQRNGWEESRMCIEKQTRSRRDTECWARDGGRLNDRERRPKWLGTFYDACRGGKAKRVSNNGGKKGQMVAGKRGKKKVGGERGTNFNKGGSILLYVSHYGLIRRMELLTKESERSFNTFQSFNSFPNRGEKKIYDIQSCFSPTGLNPKTVAFITGGAN